MKTVSTLSTWKNYNRNYQIDKIENEEKTNIIFRCVEDHPYGVLDVVEFKNISIDYTSQWLNWNNVIRCSNFFEYPPEEEIYDSNMTPIGKGYLCEAVQKALKPAVTVRKKFEDEKVKNMFADLPSSCLILPYKEEDTTFICRKGRLDDLFDINEIMRIYSLYGIKEIDWKYVTNKCKHEISFFSDNVNSGIDIERGVGGNDLVLVGLLLGYPIESTIAEISSNHKSFKATYKKEAKKNFQESENEYIDANGCRWVCDNGKVFINEQREELYY